MRPSEFIAMAVAWRFPPNENKIQFAERLQFIRVTGALVRIRRQTGQAGLLALASAKRSPQRTRSRNTDGFTDGSQAYLAGPPLLASNRNVDMLYQPAGHQAASLA